MTTPKKTKRRKPSKTPSPADQIKRLEATLAARTSECEGWKAAAKDLSRQRDMWEKAYREWSNVATTARVEIQRLRNALHQVSLCSVNSMSSRDEMGKIARKTLSTASPGVCPRCGEAGKHGCGPERPTVPAYCGDYMAHDWIYGECRRCGLIKETL